MAELSASNAPKAGQDDVLPTSAHDDNNSINKNTVDSNYTKSNRAVIRVDTSIIESARTTKLDEETLDCVDNNKSPSETTQRSAGNTPVTYLPSVPKIDPTGFYSDELRKHIGDDEPLRFPSDRTILIPPNHLSFTKDMIRNRSSDMNAAEASMKGATVTTASTPHMDSSRCDESLIDQPPARPTLLGSDSEETEGLILDESPKLSIREELSPSHEENHVPAAHSAQRVWSESPLPPFRFAKRPIPPANSFDVEPTQANLQDLVSSRSARHGNDKPISEYRRRNLQAELRKARSSCSEERQEEIGQTISRSIAREMPVNFEVHKLGPITPAPRRNRSLGPPLASFAPDSSYSADYASGSNTSNPRRRRRSPSPMESGFSSPQYPPLRSPELASSRRAGPPVPRRGGHDLVDGPTRAFSPNYGDYDRHHSWIRTPRVPGPRGMIEEDLQGLDFAGEDGNEENEELFVSSSRISAPSAKKPRLGGSSEFSSQDWANRQHDRSLIIKNPNYHLFTVPAGERRPSRYSGVEMPWGLNQDPVLVNQDEVSDASLKKRGLTRGDGDKVCKRGYGANDPENIRIVNMKEINRYSFAKIAEALNQQRIAEGRQPSMTACGVTSRYNRTAPLLFAAQGKAFVPLSKRRGRVNSHGHPTGKPAWTPELDELLVDKVKDFEQSRWPTVAQLMRDATGLPFDTESVAHRHAML